MQKMKSYFWSAGNSVNAMDAQFKLHCAKQGVSIGTMTDFAASAVTEVNSHDNNSEIDINPVKSINVVIDPLKSMNVAVPLVTPPRP